ncbi:hypothetical protein ACWEPI_35245 [Streptomyces sp. NPDC004262]
MTGFLAELGKQLANRWLSLLVLPGALYLAALAAAHRFGHTHWNEPERLSGVADWAGAPTASTASLAVFLLAVVLVAAGCGLAAQALGSALERWWLAADWPGWPGPLRRLAARSVARRSDHYAQRRTALAEARARAHMAGTPDQAGDAVDLARRRRDRIAVEPPARPTWMGDRMHAVDVRLRRDTGIDTATVWPCLWLHIPDTTRAAVTEARQELSRAATLAGWGLLYLAVPILWWPGVLVPAALTVTAWHRARSAAESYATLVDATVRLHAPGLARALDIGGPAPFTRATGAALSTHLGQPLP